MAYCIKLSKEELEEYKELNLSPNIINSAISLYLEKNGEELPSLEQLENFIKSRVYGINSLKDYKDKKTITWDTNTDVRLNPSYVRNNIKLILGNEVVTAHSTEHGFVLKTLYGLKEQNRISQEYYDYIKDFTEEDLLEKKLNSDFYNHSFEGSTFEEYLLSNIESTKDLISEVVISKFKGDNLLYASFAEDMDENLNIDLNIPASLNEVFKDYYTEAFNNALRPLALKYFNERKESLIRAMEYETEVINREEIEKAFSPLTRTSRENFIADTFISEVNKDLSLEENKGLSFIDLIKKNTVKYYLNRTKETIKSLTGETLLKSPEYFTLITINNTLHKEKTPLKYKSKSKDNILTRIRLALNREGLREILDDIIYDEDKKKEILESNEYKRREYEKMYKFFDELSKGIKPVLLRKKNVRISTKSNYLEEAEDIIDESLETKERNYDYSANEGYALDSVTKKIRQLLNSLPMTKGEEIVTDDLGRAEYLTDIYTYPILVNYLQGATTYKEMRERLGTLSKKYFWVNSLIKRLDTPKDYTPKGSVNEYESLQNEFFSSFYRNRTTYLVYKKQISNNPIEGDSYKAVEINSDRSTYRNYTEWATTYMQGITLSKNSIYDLHGKIHMDKVIALKERVESSIERLKKDTNKRKWQEEFQANQDYQKELIDILRSIGIAPDADVFTIEGNQYLLQKTKKGDSLALNKMVNSLLREVQGIIRELEDISNKNKSQVLNVNLFNILKARYFRIGNYIEPSVNNKVTKTTFKHSGKSYTSFTTPNFMQSTIDMLRGNGVEDYKKMIQDQFLKDNFFSYNHIIKTLSEDESSREVFDYAEVLSYNDRPYEEWTEKDKFDIQLLEYKKEGKRRGWFRIPVAGELKRFGFFRFNKFQSDEEIFNAFKDMVKQELERINFTKSWKEAKKKGTVIPVDNLIKNGDKFHYLPTLNTYKIEGKTLLETLEDYEHNPKYDSVDSIISEYLTPVLDNILKEELEKINSFKLDHSLSSIKDFILQDLYFRSQFSQIIGGDLANYKDIVDFQKRFKQVLSSTTRLNVTDEVQKTLYIDDEIVSTTILKEISDMVESRIKKGEITKTEGDIIIDSFSNINATDGQAYRTLDGYKFIMEKSGQWTNEMEEFKNKLEKAQSSETGDSNLTFAETQDFFFNIIKPLVYGSSMVNTGLLDSEGQPIYKRINHQHKNSEALLLGIVGFATTSPTIRALTKFTKNHGIHVINFASAVKVGKQGVINLLEKDIKDKPLKIDTKHGEKGFIFDSYKEAKEVLTSLLSKDEITKEEYLSSIEEITNTTEEEILEVLEAKTKLPDGSFNPSIVHEIPYTSYGFQTNTPEHFLEAENLLGTQMRKLMTGNITPNDSFSVIISANQEGNKTITKSGKEVIDDVNKIVTGNVYDKYEEVKEIFENPVKIEEIILDEVASNPRYGTEISKFFNLENKGTIENPQWDFEIPLEDPQNAKIVESILSGISKNRIHKMKVSGGSLIQLSNFTLSDKLQVKLKEDGKSINYIPAYVPLYSKDLLKVYNKNGEVDIERIEKENPQLLQMIGYRIPTENKHSILPIKIVGFLPNFSGGSIVLPADLTTIVGSDFDVDKLYIFKPYLQFKRFKSKNAIKASLDKISYENDGYIDINNLDYKQRNNYLFDLFWSILTSEKFAPEIFNPSGYKKLAISSKKAFISKLTRRVLNPLLEKVGIETNHYKYDIISKLTEDQVKKIISLYEAGNTPFLSSTMHYFENQNSVGLELVGISANANTFYSLAQQIKDEIKLRSSIYFLGKSYNTIGDIYNTNGELNLDIIGQFVTASVDNVKDPVLSYMGTDKNTLGSVIAAVSLGMPLEHIATLTGLGMFEGSKLDVKGYKLNYIIRTIEKILGKKGILLPDKFPSIKEESIRTIVEYLPEYRDLFNGYSGKIEENKEFLDNLSSDNLKQLKLLYVYLGSLEYLENRLEEIGGALRKIINITKVDTAKGAAGPTAANAIIKYHKILRDFDSLTSSNSPIRVDTNFLNTYKFKYSTPELIKNDLLTKADSFYKAFYHFSLESSFQYMSNYFNVMHNNFQGVLNELYSLGMNFNVKNINAVYENFLLYRLSNTPMMNITKAKELLRTIPLVYSQLINKYPELKSMLLFKTLNQNLIGNIVTLDFNSIVELNAQNRDQFTREWDELLDMGIQDPNKKEITEFAKDLYIYGLHRGMIGYKFRGINHLAPKRLKLLLTDYISTIRSIPTVMSTMEDIDINFISQLLANRVLDINVIKYTNENFETRANTDGFQIEYGKNGDDYISISEFDENNSFANIFYIEDNLYLKIGFKDGSSIFRLLPNYSKNSPFIRYDLQNNMPEYIVDGNIYKPEIEENEETDSLDSEDIIEASNKESFENKEDSSSLIKDIIKEAEEFNFTDSEGNPICK